MNRFIYTLLHENPMLYLLLSCTSTEKELDNDLAFEEELLDAINTDINQTDASAFALAVIRDGQLVWSQGFGSDTQDDSSVTGDTLFRVASLTKPMTATVALQQVDADCFALQDTVNQVITNFEMEQQPALSQNLTVKDVLQMTGGLMDVQEQSGEDGDGMIESFLPVYQELGYFLSPPGRMYNYSNSNFVLAGRMIELCTQQYFREALEEDLWAPLGMTNTRLATNSIVSNAAYALGVTTHWPNQVGEEVTVDAEAYSASHLWPAMGAWSSVNDMAAFALFLLNGDSSVLSTEKHLEMTSVQVDTEEGYPSKGYGYGLVVKDGIDMGDKHYSVEMWSHTGSIYGYSSHMYLLPEFGSGVIVLINRDNASPTNSVPIALGLEALIAGTDSQIDLPTELSEYVGTFNNDFNIGEMYITVEENGLSIEIPTLDEFNIGYDSILEPVRPDNFLLHYPDGTYDNLSFIRDNNGNVEYLRHRNYVGEKVIENSLQPSKAPQSKTIHSLFSHLESTIDVF